MSGLFFDYPLQNRIDVNENEFLAATIDELSDGKMKEIEHSETKMLLAKVNGEYYAVGAICPHYKAPLIKGALCGTKLYCPWHHSVFDITNGCLLEPPALDGLPRYKTRVENERVFIQFPEQMPEETAITKDNADAKTFIILGGGAASDMAAETLRSKRFSGRLIMITKENVLPYDRTALSKKYMSGKEKEDELPLRKEDFFQQHNIELIKNKEVQEVDADTKTILFSDGASLHYDSLLIATGGEPNPLPVEVDGYINLFLLRSANDAKKMLESAKQATKVCIIGASFIGMETAASLRTLGLDVTVIAKEKFPFEKNFGEAIGKMFYNLHRENDVLIKTEAEVEKIEGTNKAETVVLKSGERIETDMVIVGIGVHPKTDFLRGLKLNEEDKSVPVDEYLQAAGGLFAAGDIALFPDSKTNQSIRIEHWRVAQQHGRIAALNMLGPTSSLSEVVPFFWTNQFEKRLSYIGHAEEWDDIVVDGNIADQNFIAFYVKDTKVLAVASMNRDKESDQIEDMMLQKTLLTVDEIKQKLSS